jgi:hypothetical protein
MNRCILLVIICLFALNEAYSFNLLHHNHGISADSTAMLTDSTDTSKAASEKSRYIDFSVEYGSNFTYRHQINQNPTEAPYLYPTLFYHAKSGFWATAGAYRLIKPYQDVTLKGNDTSLAPTFIEYDFSAGWDFKAGKSTDFSVSYLYSVFDRQIPFLKEALANTFEGYAGHDFKIIYTGLRFDYTWQNFTATINNKKQGFPVHDFYGMWETSHEWFIDDAFKSGDEFDINPMFTVLAGTNNFIGKFITLRYPEGTKNGAKAAAYAKLAGKFLIQQFTLNVPVAYTIGNFTFTPSFEYTLLTQKKTETEPTSYPIYRFSAAYRFNMK